MSPASWPGDNLPADVIERVSTPTTQKRIHRIHYNVFAEVTLTSSACRVLDLRSDSASAAAILTRFTAAQARERAGVKGRGTSSRTCTPTDDIYAIKTKDGGVLVTGGMRWQVDASLTGRWQWTPKKSAETYRLHPTPYQSRRYEYNAIWAVQIPVKGKLKLVSWNSHWTNFTAS